MKFPEQNLYSRFSKRMQGLGKPILLERHEDMLGSGLPDVNILCSGVVTWLELKERVEKPKRPTTRLLGDSGLNIDQKNWHMEWIKHGGRVVTLVGLGSYEYFLVDGIHSDDLNEMDASQMAAVAIIASDARKDPRMWEDMYNFFRGLR